MLAIKTQSIPYIRLLRIHHWSKNSLIFLPLFTANQVNDVNKLLAASITFICFSLIASFGYIINDISDYEHDKNHPTKKERSIACELIKKQDALLFSILLLTLGLWIAWIVATELLISCVTYLTLSLTYSFLVRKIIFLDIFMLAIMFTLRIAAGSVVTGLPLGYWLVSFSLCLFCSLATVKRISEFSCHMDKSHIINNGRAYKNQHLKPLFYLGMITSCMAIIIFILYSQSAEAIAIYQNSNRLWIIAVLLGFWLARLWRFVRQGNMHDDPIVFALKDKTSMAMGLLVIFTFLWAH